MLLERAETMNVDCTHKLLNSSKTLQIIQSRLEIRQKQYADALIQQNKEQVEITTTTSVNRQFSYLSDNESLIEDDQESFVSAESVRKFNFKKF